MCARLVQSCTDNCNPRKAIVKKKCLALELAAALIKWCTSVDSDYSILSSVHSMLGTVKRHKRTTKSHSRMASGFLASSYRPKLASEFVTTQANLQNQECSTEESNCSHCLKALVQVNNEVHTPYSAANLT